MESSTNDETIENFSNLTYRQRFAITEYGYLLSPENAEVVGKMLGNFQAKDILPFCQANGKKVSFSQKIMADIPFWSNWKQKLRSFFFIVISVFVLTLPWSLLSIFIYPILVFPTGLIGLVYDYYEYAYLEVLLAIPLWVIYFGLAAAIALNNKKKVIISLYIILIFLLILNVAGCHVIAPTMIEGIS